MPEQEVNSAAAKFISSLVKSLQILCNGQVEFAESIELVGHINVRVDHKYKFDYIVDEQVSKEGEDSSTTFLSNSYHSCPPLKQHSKKLSPSQLDQDVMFAEIPQNALAQSRPRQSTEIIEPGTQSQDFSAEDQSHGDVDSNPNYSVTVESSCGGEIQANQMVVKLEGGDDSNDCMVLPASPESHGSQTQSRSRKRRQPVDQGNSAVKVAAPPAVSGYLGTQGEQKQLKEKHSVALSCKEYLEKYNIAYAKPKLSNKQEMIKVFSNLSQKYGVAITIKPAKYTALSSTSVINSSDLSLTASMSNSGMLERQASVNEKYQDMQTSCKSLGSMKTVVTHTDSAQQSPAVFSTSSVNNLPIGSQIVTVITTDTDVQAASDGQYHPQECQSMLQESDDVIKQISDSDVILTGSEKSFSGPAITLSSPERLCSFEHLGSGPSDWITSHGQLAVTPSKMVTRSTGRMGLCDTTEPDSPSSALLSAIAVALAEEETASISSHAQEFPRQQPTPKHRRKSHLTRLRKEDPERYEQYKQLSKEEQARERRRISEANRDPDTIEKKSLMNRIQYLRRVGKLPSCFRDKNNDDIRKIPTEELKKLLPPTKSLKHMDPAAKEEWYRLGRSREWRRRKKLLDPEGFKRYNNERAKKYQEKLKKNNPEKFKELRAKAADRLRQYRFSQRIMKAIKEGKEIKISETSLGSNRGRQKRARGKTKIGDTVEVREAEEELLIEENIDKAHYIIPECATTHGEAATSRESSSTQTVQSVQPDILDLMYNY